MLDELRDARERRTGGPAFGQSRRTRYIPDCARGREPERAGLSAAVVALADASGPVGYVVVLVLGNVLILALEGLVVGIQTTRLMMFEFFVRFLTGTGRAFRPLPPPFVPLPHRNGSPA